MEARAAFLTCASLSAAAVGYHLEFVAADEARAARLEWMLGAIASPPKRVQRNARTVRYYKDAQAIGDFLTLIGAHAALLQLEDVRAIKETKNRIHRLVNTEAANLDRSAAAAAAHRRTIEMLADRYGIARLTPALREIAELRLAHPDETLTQLGGRCRPPIGKSTVNSRLVALGRLANAVHGESDAAARKA